MKQLSVQQRLWMGVTLFSMFFGAGNLIFPPFTGYAAGSDAFAASVGLISTAVLFPVLGVIATAYAGGMDGLCKNIHPKFSAVFTIVIYICIGPLLAIPRTASTAYSMFGFLTAGLKEQQFAGAPLTWWIGVLFSLLFFSGAYYFAQNPSRLKNVLGKYMTPVLLVLVLVMFVGGVFYLQQAPAAPRPPYHVQPFARGFTEGYQTMDALAVMVFGIVVVMNVRDFGIEDEKQLCKETAYSGMIAGVLLTIVYSMLLYLGAKSSAVIPEAADGTEVLSILCKMLFGNIGAVILAAIFFVACFNVCTSLLSSCAAFFSKEFPLLPFKTWLCIFAGASFVISILGLQTILQISGPILTLIYPAALVIIVMNLLPWKLVKLPVFQRIVVALAFAYSIWEMSMAA